MKYLRCRRHANCKIEIFDAGEAGQLGRKLSTNKRRQTAVMRERDAADAAEVCLGSWKSLSLSHVTACLVDNMYVCSKTARATKALLYLLCYTILNFIGPALKIGNEFIAKGSALS